MEAGLETRFDGNPLHFRILTGYAGLCRQQCPLRGRGEDFEFFVVLKADVAPLAPGREEGAGGEG